MMMVVVGGGAHSDSFSIPNFHVFILLLGGGGPAGGEGSSFTPNVLNSLDIIKKTNGIMQVWSHIFRGGSSSAPTGLTLLKGGLWMGVGWTVELTVGGRLIWNGFQRGTCNPPNPPLDPPLIWGRTPITWFSNSLCIRSRSSLVMWKCQWWQVAVTQRVLRLGAVVPSIGHEMYM